ncbi:Copper type II, ascorbate-dependent monooxygenase-like, C-terminal,DOMON domain,Copper type II [Cinara cedri]|uniref:Copper type II, ascorbate-dependent monooxygenase-like, C-terminal,DOMON domain,Copper type II n=1 Tax=Cinara cedri TaxID=506608 RepID=A0A5E4N750_9HEMI|nr:Copper type II, ascorbate-dependent monooxygenase-like, C-terminal,DOMON domain,Copper type II [Cinara cedri]
MPWTSLSLLSLLCAVCACAAAATVAVVPPSPPPFQSANFSTATVGGKYDKTVSAGDEMSVSVREYADCAVFSVQARTRGYVAMAFADQLAPARSVDVLLAWVDDETGIGYVVDMHGKTEAGLTPEKDVSQDYELLASSQNGSHTTVVFRRAWDTCDAHDDALFGNDTMRMFWTMSDRDPIDRHFTESLKLGSSWKGTQSFYPRGPKFRPNTDYYKRWDVTMDNLHLKDNVDTLYWCKIFKAPKVIKKNHIVGFLPLLNTDTRHLIHHMILYECDGGPNTMEKYVTLKGAQCYGNGMPEDWDKCVSPVVTWGMGSDGQFLPDHIGVPITGRDVYYMLEVHYDNPTLRKVMDNSGLRVYYTENLRANDAGVMAVGTAVSPIHIVPPKQSAYRTASLCDKDCTNVIFPEQGIKITSVLLHAHLASRQLRLRHVRHDQEMSTIVKDNHYDYNYQQARELTNEVTVYPGDELITECVYNTADRPQLTHGGYSTKQEMCLAFVTYYPRTPLASCFSMTPVPFFFETFGIQQFLNYNMEGVEKIFLKMADTTTKKPPAFSTTPSFDSSKSLDELNQAHISYLLKQPSFTIEDDNEPNLFKDLEIMEPVEFQNKTFQQHLDNLPWEEALFTGNIERQLINGKHMTFCRLHNDTLALMINTYVFPNFTEYSEPKTAEVTCVPLSNKFRNAASKTVQSSYLSMIFVSSTALIYIKLY